MGLPRRRQHNYIRKVREFVERYGIPAAGLHHIGVLHDDWCGVHRGGRCDCDPEIRWLGPEPPVPSRDN
jgi:hypothetical protein